MTVLHQLMNPLDYMHIRCDANFVVVFFFSGPILCFVQPTKQTDGNPDVDAVSSVGKN